MSRNPVLDEVKRGQIVALASSGFSRRSIARYVGCAAATIDNTADRLPDFAEQLAEAERKFVQTHSDNIARHAAGSWRALAWLMEHLQPEEFGRRPAKAASPAQNASQFAAWSRQVVAAVPLYTRGAVQRVTREMLANLRNGQLDLAADAEPSSPADHSTAHPPGDETPLTPPTAAPHAAPASPADSPLRIDNADPRAVDRLFKLVQTMLRNKRRFEAISLFREATGVSDEIANAAVNSISEHHPQDAVEVAGLADPRSIKQDSAPAPAAQPAAPAGAAQINMPPGGVVQTNTPYSGDMHINPPPAGGPVPPASTAIPMAAPVPNAIPMAASVPSTIPMAAPVPSGVAVPPTPSANPMSSPNSWPVASSALLLLLAFVLGGLAIHAQSEHFPLDVPPVPLNNSPLPVDSALRPAWAGQSRCVPASRGQPSMWPIAPQRMSGLLCSLIVGLVGSTPGQLAWPEQRFARLAGPREYPAEFSLQSIAAAGRAASNG